MWKEIKEEILFFLERVCSAVKRIPRWFRFLWQRKTRGWDDSDTWSMDITIAQFILPRLKRFKELSIGVPGCIECSSDISFEEKEKIWNDILSQMIEAFEMLADSDLDWQFNKEYEEKINRGLDLFRKYYFNLWW